MTDNKEISERSKNFSSMNMSNHLPKTPNQNKESLSLERKTYMEMTPEEMEYMMKQAVLSRDVEDPSGFVTKLDESGNLCRQYDDGHREKKRN